MSLAKKLNLKAGAKLRVVGKPAGLDLGDVETTTAAKTDAILIFVKQLAEVDAKCAPMVALAKEDKIAWVAYPKAGQLDTDLSRDVLWKRLLKEDIQGVRQISIDDVWSAMRFRPAPGKLHPTLAKKAAAKKPAPRGTKR